MQEESSRHHYIPKFYINEFLNEEKKLFVYYKKQDEIKTRSYPSKSIFFEWDRNTITIKNKETSELETFYSGIDSFCAPEIIKLRENENKNGILNVEGVSMVKYFMLNLLWRIPFTDKVFEELHKETKINIIDRKTGQYIEPEKEMLDFFKSKDHEKLARSKYVNQMILETIKNGSLDNDKFQAQLFGFGNDYFLLGDNPIVFYDTPKTFKDLMSEQYIIPISSKRIFCSRTNSELKLSQLQIDLINAVIILQSENYIASPNIDYLRGAVQFFKETVLDPQFQFVKEIIFKKK